MVKSPGLNALNPFFSFILKLAAFYCLFFLCCRLLFCYFNIPASNNEGFEEYASAFIKGLRFDLVIVSYLLMLPVLLLFLHRVFLRSRAVIAIILKWYLYLLTGLVFFITCSDIPYFSQFGSHITKSVFAWRLTPHYTLQLIFSNFFYWGFSLLFLAWFICFVFFIKRITAIYLADTDKHAPASKARLIYQLLVLVALLFIMARGRLSVKSTIHEGMAIVGQNAFVNQIALNPNFTLIKSLGRKHEKEDYLKTIPSDLKICSRFFSHNYFPENGVLAAPVRATTSPDSIRPLNIIVVLMESMSMAKMGYYGNKNLSPYLTQLAKESVFFDRFFSSGIHTFNGLFSSASGFPSIYTEQGLRQDTRQPFGTLAGLLKPYGYRAYFCCTHDPVFDNMEGFFALNSFDRLISSNDFSNSESIGVTGIPDHKLYNKLVETINADNKNQPFVAYVMTGTDHGPWTIPEDISFKPDGSTARERASQYADWAVQQFLTEAKKQAWYKNTVFVFLGDHGQIMNDVYDMPITYHHIPLIIHCPQILEAGVNHHLGYQPDLIKTVSSLMRVNYPNFSFGVNIFEENRPFVFFSADDKLGYVTDDDFFFYHLLGSDQKRLVRYTKMDRKDYYPAYKTHADSLYRIMQSLYHSAQYYLHNNYFNF